MSEFNDPFRGPVNDPFRRIGGRRAEAITGPPVKVSSITPADGAIHIQLDRVISWGRPAMAQYYRVYIGATAETLVEVSAEGGQEARSFVQTLALDSTYFLRIDAGNTLGVTTGDVTSFSTWSIEDILTDENSIPLTDETGAYLEDS